MKILLNGYFHKNFGDDLFFHMIRERYNQHMFYVPIESEISSAYIGEKNVRILKINKFIRALDKVLFKVNYRLSYYNFLNRSADLSVLIGGSMFQEISGDVRDLKRIDALPIRTKSLYILGVNFGPYKSDIYLERCKKYLSKATDICFRDNESYSLFKELNNTRVATDIVFGIEKILPKSKYKNNNCIISVMDFTKRDNLKPYQKDYERFLINNIENQLLKGREVILTSFCQYEGDENAIERIMNICKEKKYKGISTHYYDGYNWRETLRIISESSCIIASRFHAMILGITYGIPTLPIIYNEKCKKILNDIECNKFGVDLNDLRNFDKKEFNFIPPQDLTILKQKSELQFYELDKVLLKK